MTIYLGVLSQGFRATNYLYMSSVSPDDQKFDSECILTECSTEGSPDDSIALVDLNILRNKLANIGVPNEAIIMDSVT